jgi:hypothetical protein
MEGLQASGEANIKSIVMTLLPELVGQILPVKIYALNDKHFKKPKSTSNITFKVDPPIAPLLQYVSVRNTPIKLRTDKEALSVDEVASQVTGDWAVINDIFTQFTNSEFIVSFYRLIQQRCDSMESMIRDDEGELIGGYRAKKAIAEMFSSLLSTETQAIACGVSKGGLSINDKPLVNSGLTHFVNPFAMGLFSFLGIDACNYTITEYDTQVNKASIGVYEIGGAMNPLGDTLHIAQFRLCLLSAFVGFVKTISSKSQIDFEQTSPEVFKLLQEAKQTKQELETLVESCFPSQKLTKEEVLGIEAVRSDDNYLQLKQLGLGVEAEYQFYEWESWEPIFSAIAKEIGARRVNRFSTIPRPQNDYEYHEPDPEFTPHIPLPSLKVRSGMTRLFSLIADTSTVAAKCFDMSTLRINVSSSCDYNHQTGEVNSTEYLRICRGVKEPLAKRDLVISFVFDA